MAIQLRIMVLIASWNVIASPGRAINAFKVKYIDWGRYRPATGFLHGRFNPNTESRGSQ